MMTKCKAFSIKENLELVDRVRNREQQAKIVRATVVNEATLRGSQFTVLYGYNTRCALGPTLLCYNAVRLWTVMEL